MEQKIFRYGTQDLDQATIFHNIALNIGSYMDHQMYSPEERTEFNNSVTDIVNKMKEGTLRSDEIGNLTTTGTWENSDMSRQAVDYVKKVMTAVAKKFPKKEEVVEEPVKEKFDYNKHGFTSYFLEQSNPRMLGTSYENKEDFITDFSNTLDSWRNQYSTDAEAISAFSNLLDSYKTKHQYQDLDFSTYGMTSDSYLNDINLLQESLKDGSIDNVDEFRLGKLGLSNYSRLFKRDAKPVDKKDGQEFVETPVLKTQVSGANMARKPGDWYEEIVNGVRTRYVINNKGEHTQTPIISVNSDRINALKTMLKMSYGNRYESEGMENKINGLEVAINNYGSGTKAFSDAITSLQGFEEVKQLLKGIGYTDENANNYIKSLTNLKEEPEFDISQFLETLEDEDYVRLASSVLDIGSAIAAFFPGWGTGISFGAGALSTVGNAVADFTLDSDMSKWEALKNLGRNVGLDVWGALPIIGSTGKFAKLGKILKATVKDYNVYQALNTLLMAYGGYGTATAFMNAVNKASENPSELTSEDLQALLGGVNVLAGAFAAKGQRKAAETSTNTTELFPIKTKSGKTVHLTQEQLDNIRSKKTIEEQNVEFEKLFENEELKNQQTSSLGQRTYNWYKKRQYNTPNDENPNYNRVRQFVKNTSPGKTDNVIHAITPRSTQILNAKGAEVHYPKNGEIYKNGDKYVKYNSKTKQYEDLGDGYDVTISNGKYTARKLNQSTNNEQHIAPSQKRFNSKGEEITNLEIGKIYRDEKGDFYKFKEDNTWEPIPKEKVITEGDNFVLKEDDTRFKPKEEQEELPVEESQKIEGNVSEAQVEVKPDIESQVSPKKSANYERRKNEYGEEIADLMETIENLGLSKNKQKKYIGKLDAELKKLKGNKSKSLDDDTLQILQEIINSNSSGKGYFSDQFNKTTSVFQQVFPDKNLKEIRQMLINKGFYKQGGILKMDNGGWFEKVLKKLGQQTSLNGWTPELNNSNRGSLNKNLNASNVSTLYELNDAYTKDLTAVNKDLNAYFTTPGSEVMSPEQLINLYNQDIELIDSYHNDPYNYGDTKEGLADTHKRVYASMNQTGDKAYNIGFNEDIKNEMGSGNFHRRAVKYEKDFDTLSDLEKQNRIYQIGEGDKSFWVKTLSDGKIGLLDNAEAARILAVKPAESTETETETKLEGGGEGGLKIPEKEAKLVKPKDKDLNNQDYALFGNVFKYLDTLRHNKKQMDLANQMTPLLYDPVEHNRYIVGNLDAVTQGQQNYAKLRQMASRPMTSDASLQLASQLEAESKGLEYLTQGKILDNQAIRESQEKAWEQEKANKENRYNIAMKNRENIWQVDREKLQARMVKERSDWQSKQHLMDSAITSLIGYQQRQNAETEKENAEQEAAFGKMLTSHIEKTPNSYIEGWDKNFQAAYDKYQRGEILNERETQMINQIHQAMEDAYLENMHPNYKWNSARVYLNRIHRGDFNFDIQLPRKSTAKGKKGMKITNDMAKTIIACLKESNNMYNKAVDRSVRGLYNHIKEQKRNKRK